MKSFIIILSLFAAIAVVSGCSSVGLDDVRAIKIRSGLTQQEVKCAILTATLPEKKAAEFVPAAAGSDEVLRTAYEKLHQQPARGPHWKVEQIKDNALVLEYRRDQYALRVEYVIRSNKVMPRILSSRNLNQTSTRIHGNASDWMRDLQSRIAEHIEHLADAKMALAQQ